MAAAIDALGDANDVFATADLTEAAKAYETMASRSYGVVVCGGGDGTLAATIKGMADARRQRYGETAEEALANLPRFALVPLGTGNAMASLVGPPKGKKYGRGGAKTLTKVLEVLKEDCHKKAKGRFMAGDAARANGAGDGEQLLGTITVPLVEVRDDLLDIESQETSAEGCFLAGCGYDSFILDDYSR